MLLVINYDFQPFVYGFIWIIPRNKIAGSYSSSIFLILRSYHLFFIEANCTSLTFCKEFLFCIFTITCYFYFWQSHLSRVSRYCAFDCSKDADCLFRACWPSLYMSSLENLSWLPCSFSLGHTHAAYGISSLTRDWTVPHAVGSSRGLSHWPGLGSPAFWPMNWLYCIFFCCHLLYEFFIFEHPY